MNEYYITLTRELTGYCIKALAPNELLVRLYCSEHYGHLWCSIYSSKPTEKVIGQLLYIEDDNE